MCDQKLNLFAFLIKIVQEALEVAQKGRTCISVAHRISTIKKADTIFVVQKGRIVEFGNHDSLIKLNNVYSKLQ